MFINCSIASHSAGCDLVGGDEQWVAEAGEEEGQLPLLLVLSYRFPVDRWGCMIQLSDLQDSCLMSSYSPCSPPSKAGEEGEEEAEAAPDVVTGQQEGDAWG